MTKDYKTYDQLPLTLQASDLSSILGISRAGAYELMHQSGFPTLFIGKRMVVPRDKFLQWMDMQLAVSAS